MKSTNGRLQKEDERRQFDWFRKSVPDFPNGEIISGESPDFLVSTHESDSLGIELIEIQDGLVERVRAGTLQQLVKIAQRKAEELNLPPLAVSVCFNWPVEVKKHEQESLAAKMVDEIVSKLDEASTMSHSWIPTSDEDRNGKLSRLKQTVGYFSIERSSHAIWTADPGGQVHENFTKHLQNTIDSKDEKYSKYLENCRRCWLLVYSDAEDLDRGGESFYELSDEMKAQEYISSFERVYFMAGYEHDVTRLRIRPPK